MGRLGSASQSERTFLPARKRRSFCERSEQSLARLRERPAGRRLVPRDAKRASLQLVYTLLTVSASVVIVGPVEALPALRDFLDSGAELHAFTDGDALEALDHIIRHKPRIIAIDRLFAAGKRGIALINRIKADPSLADCELRIVAREEPIEPLVEPISLAVATTSAPAVALDRHGTRRARRVLMSDGVEVLVDGNPAMLVDLSVLGGQVMSTKVLKPNQRVRITLSDARGIIRCGGAIMWASFEMPKGVSPRYRAGIEFKNPDVDLLAGFIERHSVQLKV